MSHSEVFDLINSDGEVIGRATRKEVHGNPTLLHRVVHVLVFDADGRIYLQKRAEDKDVQPGRWDTSVGGHVDAGESVDTAVRRELSEELGIPGSAEPPELLFLHEYIHSNDYESEMVTTWMCRWNGPMTLQQSEISDGGFWEPAEIDFRVGNSSDADLFTPNFLDELRRWRKAGSPRP